MNNKILRDITYGMYAVTAKDEERNVGCIINTLAQITSDPMIVSLSLNKLNYTNEVIKKTKRFGISVISEKTNPNVIGEFGFKTGKDVDKFEKFNFSTQSDLPIIDDNMCGYIICEVINIIDVGTHDIFISKIIDMNKTSDNVPMTYKYYHEVIKGTAPQNAPTFTETKMAEKENNTSGDKYVCTICGYIYDNEKEEIPFEELPDDWKCPICGAPKSVFEKLK